MKLRKAGVCDGQRFAWIILYLFSYIMDMTHNDIVITSICFIPNNIIYLLFSKHPESLLVRVTRGCHWNKCYFCGLYKSMNFSMRPIEDTIQDIKEVFCHTPAFHNGICMEAFVDKL